MYASPVTSINSLTAYKGADNVRQWRISGLESRRISRVHELARVDRRCPAQGETSWCLASELGDRTICVMDDFACGVVGAC